MPDFWLTEDADMEATQEKLINGITNDFRLGIGGQLDQQDDVRRFQSLKAIKVEAG
jgi:hypothetical protein